MFGIGTGEILIILLIALLVLGPNEIPKVARTIGKTMRDLQRTKDEIRQSIDKEFEDIDENKKTPEKSAEENKGVKQQDRLV
ncbi:MAG TPA: Sec-independent protein translocase protein TatB [Thermodesulfobacteriota bacterium]|jgi:sec-independent protein translocase protein TatB|nr:Sec-independent protein translocase protein TatB [Candidatus Brocadiales bacterium]